MDLEELDPSMRSFFIPRRMIIRNRKDSIQLKQHTDWNWRIAFADCNDSISSINKYYPKKDGIGYWLEHLA